MRRIECDPLSVGRPGWIRAVRSIREKLSLLTSAQRHDPELASTSISTENDFLSVGRPAGRERSSQKCILVQGYLLEILLRIEWLNRPQVPLPAAVGGKKQFLSIRRPSRNTFPPWFGGDVYWVVAIENSLYPDVEIVVVPGGVSDPLPVRRSVGFYFYRGMRGEIGYGDVGRDIDKVRKAISRGPRHRCSHEPGMSAQGQPDECAGCSDRSRRNFEGDCQSGRNGGP